METGKREDIGTRASGTTPVAVQGTGGMGRGAGGQGDGIADVAMVMVMDMVVMVLTVAARMAVKVQDGGKYGALDSNRRKTTIGLD